MFSSAQYSTSLYTIPITDIEDYSQLVVTIQSIFLKTAQSFTEKTLEFITSEFVPIIVIVISIAAFTAFTSYLPRVFNLISFEFLD